LFHFLVHFSDVAGHFLFTGLNTAVELNLHFMNILLHLPNTILHLGVKLTNLLLNLLLRITKIIFNRLVLDGNMLLYFGSLFADEFVEGSVLAFDVVFDLRYQTSKVGITVIIVVVSGQNKTFNLINTKHSLVQNSEFSVELTHLNIFEHEGRIHNITVRFGNNRDQEVKKNNQNQELIHKPNKPDQIDA